MGDFEFFVRNSPKNGQLDTGAMSSRMVEFYLFFGFVLTRL